VAEEWLTLSVLEGWKCECEKTPSETEDTG
jgi:hypothetical protein